MELSDFRDFTEPDDAPPGTRPRLAERVRAGRELFDLHFPCLLDTEESTVAKLYFAFPRRMLVVDADGLIAVDSTSFPGASLPWREATDWLDNYDPATRIGG